jgi:hypothetical protein
MIKKIPALIGILLLLSCGTAGADESKPIQLFDGKDLTGWKMAGPGSFTVENGELHTHGGMGLLWYDQREFGDFTLKVQFKVSSPKDNSGVFVRFPDPGNDPWVAVRQGHEIQIDDGEKPNNFTGSIYDFQNASAHASKPTGQWNQFEITVVGKKYTVKLNGKVVNEYTTQRPLLKGYVGLQNHFSDVSFRDVEIVPLDDKEASSQPSAQGAAGGSRGRVAGLVGRYYRNVNNFGELEKAAKGKPFFSRVDPRINFKSVNGEFFKTKLVEHFGAIWSGYIRAPKSGDYTFVLRSDDGSRLYIDDKLVLDNDNPGPDRVMKDKSGSPVHLTKGDHAIRVEFYNFGGPGGMELAWKNPQGKTPGLAAKWFYHDPAQAQVDWDHLAWQKTEFKAPKVEGPWTRMDYGPFICATIKLADDNYALKGISIHLGDKDEAAMVFDTDLLRFGAGWTGDFLDLTNVAFSGQHGVNSTPAGKIMFVSPQLPGAMQGQPSERIAKDPRPKPFGPIPHDWAKYKGLYLHGKRVVLHYTVGNVDVLDTPWAQSVDGKTVLTRTIKLSASDQPLTMLIDKPGEDEAPALAASAGVQVQSLDGNRYVVFPARQSATTYRIAIAPDSALKPADLDHVVAQNEDVDALIQPGPARWTIPVITKGEVATSTTQPYVLDTITAPEENPWHSWLRFGGFDFFSDGRAAVSTWSGDVWLVSGIDSKLDKITWKRFATGLFQPLGLKIVDDQVYVLGRDQITKLIDNNHDGEADSYECFNNDCQVSSSFHEFAFDLQTDSKGNFYYTKAGPVNPGGRGWQIITDNNGDMLRVSKDGSKFEVFASGLRAPNGMSIGPDDQITVADNEGTWVPACRLSFVRPGSDMLGVPDLSHANPPPKKFDPPICWLPHGDVDNSSGGQVWVTSDKWGPFKDRLLHMSYGTCSLFLAMYEKVDDTVQGGVVKFPDLPFITGIDRGRFNPVDHQLYVTGRRGWQTTAVKDCGFQRVRYTGAPVHMPSELHVKKDGVSITFTTPVDSRSAVDPGNWNIEQWNYHWSSDYGSAEWSVMDPKEKGHDGVDVEKVTISPDKKTVFLKLDEVIPVMQMKIQMKIKSADGNAMNYAIYNTINKVPGKTGTIKGEAVSVK